MWFAVVEGLGSLGTLSYTAGPPSKERGPAIKKLRATLEALERKEESLICDALAVGVSIPRRSDADPRIVLNYDPAGVSPDIGARRFVGQPGPSVVG